MTTGGTWDWLDVLRTPNADVRRFNTVLKEQGLRVPTLLDGLADRWLDAVDGTRSVLLIAHAGDGKTEFLRHLADRAEARGVTLRTFDKDGTTPDWDRQGSWLLNDPSQLPTERVMAFLAAAFGCCPRGGIRVVAGINRGLLRAIVQRREAAVSVDQQAWTDAREWLLSALSSKVAAHVVDDHGRIAVPIDRRVLVPGPSAGAESIDRSRAEQVAARLLTKVRDQLNVAAWDPVVWAARIAQVLSLVEASGHHVTFREVLALATAVGQALRDDPANKEPGAALAALFVAAGSDAAKVPSLAPLVTVLRRLDPAKVPHPDVDLAEHSGIDRDIRVRREALDSLARSFVGPALVEGIPYETAGIFLSACRLLAHDELAGQQKALSLVFRGLARVAWGREGRGADADLDVLPLTSPVHPGALGGARVLRAALSMGRAKFVPEDRAHGDFVERGLMLPSLVIEQHGTGSGREPRLRLDLDLFDKISLIGRDRHADVALLGPRAVQVTAWFDALVAAWANEIARPTPAGVVVFQTFLGAGRGERPVALRPSTTGANVKPDDAEPGHREPLEVLIKAARERVVVTPSACASALLRWAGFGPLPLAPERAAEQLEREALGALRHERLRRQSSLLTPTFPWSSHTLGLVLDSKGVVSTKGNAWSSLGHALGAACARALGLDDSSMSAWRGALRAAWADDEKDFDAHPSARLAHQWLNVGVEGLQMEKVSGLSHPPAAIDVRRGVVGDLLSTDRLPPFSRPLRWWLLGTWASWWLLLEGLRAAHERQDALPLLLPWVSDPRGNGEYTKVRNGWFALKGEANQEGLEAVLMLAQGSRWLTPASAITHFDLLLDGPLLDILRLVARRVHLGGERRPDHRTIERLQRGLLDAGLYLQPPGKNVQNRVPEGAMSFESPDSSAFSEALRAALQRLGMLDAASDGVALFNAPWGEEVVA